MFRRSDNNIKDIIVVDNLLNGKKISNLKNLDILDYIDKDDFLTMIENGKFDNKIIKSVIELGSAILL